MRSDGLPAVRGFFRMPPYAFGASVAVPSSLRAVAFRNEPTVQALAVVVIRLSLCLGHNLEMKGRDPRHYVGRLNNYPSSGRPTHECKNGAGRFLDHRSITTSRNCCCRWNIEALTVRRPLPPNVTLSMSSNTLEKTGPERRLKAGDMVTLPLTGNPDVWQIKQVYWLQFRGQVYDVHSGNMTMFAMAEEDLCLVDG